jgi:hypothetical protein
MPPGSGVLAQAVQSYSILAPVNINASSYPAPYSKNKGRSGTGQLSPIFNGYASAAKVCSKSLWKPPQLGDNSPSKATLKHKSEPLSREGAKQETGDECHVHAPSSGGAGCWSRSRFVRHRRVDWPRGVHAYKVVLGRMAASTISQRPAIYITDFRSRLNDEHKPFCRF